jgi:hypothetical protein
MIIDALDPNCARAEFRQLASGLECLQIRYDIRDLIRIEPKLRHGRMVGNNTFGQAPAQTLDRKFEVQCAERGAIVSGLSVTLSMAWHCAQCTRTKVRPRCAAGDCARADSPAHNKIAASDDEPWQSTK